MKLSWLMRLRIAAAVATGVVLIGILAWPIAASSGSFGVVLAGDISFGGAIILIILAFLAGLIAFFLSWPFGREIGILAAPSGLAVWAVRSGSMTALMQLKPSIAQRQALLITLKWEPIFWLVIVAAGFAGVLLGQKIRSNLKTDETQKKSNAQTGKYLKAIIALVGSVLIAQFCLKVFAQNVRMFDNRLVSVMAQPTVGQVVFGVLVSFGLAAFVVKKFLDASYIWPTLASALITAFTISIYVKQEVLQYLVQHWPAAFFSNTVVSILPVQMVAFGTLGSIVGYWLAVRYDYWRKQEIK